MNRLAMLRDEIGITQRALAERSGFSVPYIKKLELGSKPMSKRPARAIALATGVDWRWLSGRGKLRPIMARLGLSKSQIKMAFKNTPSSMSQKLLAEGVYWQKAIADRIQSRHRNPKDEENPNWNESAAQRESQACQHLHMIYSDQLAQIILESFKADKTNLVLVRIGDAVKELANEFNVKLTGFRRNTNITKRLADDLKAEIDRRFSTKKPAARK